jgi:3-deoxy-D-manno-octulosonic-acid transferase
MLSDVRLAVMQSEQDATRLAALGIAPAKLCISGNLKFDAPPLPTTTALTEQLRSRFELSGEVPVILAASTHAPEEEMLLKSFQTLKHKPARLIIAPRHPERFQEVASLLQQSGLKWARRTSEPSPNDVETDVILLDTIGELPATYSLASIVFVGGSIVDRGGHNVLEPAAVGKVVVTGAHTHNFDAIVTLLNDADAIVQMPPVEHDEAAETLRDTLDDLLSNKSRCEELSERARQLVIENRGATERTVEFLRPLLIHAGEVK